MMRAKIHDSNVSGFTLVELSIVLVILGLLVGGVLSGQSLIRAAELRSVTRESQQYQTAINSFRDKYFAIPGDMANATKYWGAVHATPSTCITTASTGIATCDGDGNGQIGYDNPGYSPTPYEGFRAWQHLANAGLIEGTYDGVTRSPGNSLGYAPGANVPKSRISGGMWGVWYLAGRATSGAWDWSPQEPGHYLALGTISGPNAGGWFNAVLKPDDAYNIDMKLDDGMPYTGRINDMSNTSYTPNCTTNETAAAAYNLSYTSPGCLLFIRAI